MTGRELKRRLQEKFGKQAIHSVQRVPYAPGVDRMEFMIAASADRQEVDKYVDYLLIGEEDKWLKAEGIDPQELEEIEKEMEALEVDQ